MNDEQLSALMDDELSQDATRQAVTELLAEAEARATWARYHLLGDALRSAADNPASVPARPPAAKVVPFPGPARWPISRTGVGLAAAATLAAVALIIAAPGPQHSDASHQLAMKSTVGAPTLPAQVASLAGAELVSNVTTGEPVDQIGIVKEDEAQKRMNTYLINFNEQRARQRTPGVHPYVRIVGYDTP